MHAQRFPSMTHLAGAIALALAAQCRAATILVESNGCLLGDAIVAANTDAGFGTCLSQPGSGDDTITIDGDQTLTGELPAITSNIAFTSAVASTTIFGDGLHRLFLVGFSGSAPTVSFNNLTLSGGKAAGGAGVGGGGGGGGLGGAIFIYDGDVSLDQVTLSANTATGGSSSGTPSIGSPYPGASVGSGGGGGGGMFGIGGGGGTIYAGGSGGSGGFGGGGGGGGTDDCESGGAGGAGGGPNGGSGGSFSPQPPTAGSSGGFGGGGGGGGPSVTSNVASQPGGNGGFGGGGGGGAGQCTGVIANTAAGIGAAGGFGGGGGAGGSFSNLPGISGGAGGFGGGAGATGAGEGGTAVASGGFGGGDAALVSFATVGGGGGAGLGGAIFVRSGHLDVRNSAFMNSSATGGGANANANPGQGKGGAIFAMHVLAEANGNDQGMPAALPTVSGCANVFSGNSASDAGTTARDNADTFGADQVGLALGCNDRIFADGFGLP